MARLSIYLLGQYEIYLDEVKLDGLYSQARALLAFLVVESHRKHSREKLAEMLWPDDPRDLAKQNLRQAISRLRATLGDRDSKEPFILASRTDVQFNPLSDFWCDSDAFNCVIFAYQHIGKKNLTPESLAWMKEAAELYRGHFFEHFHTTYSDRYYEWARSHAGILKCQAIAVVEKLCRYYEQCGDLAEAINYAHEIVSIERWAEGPRRLLVRLLAASGQEVAAVAQCNSCDSMLRDELGVEPSVETVNLCNRIKKGVANTEAGISQGLAAVSSHGHERRHVTILSCSVDLNADENPERIVYAVRKFTETCRDIARRYGGFPYALSGDECAICFGYPGEHKNTEILAARAAMALRKVYRGQHRASALKLGLCTGDVLVVSYQGAALRHFIGDPVTQADFLRQMGGRGECVLAETTYRKIHKHFSCLRRRNPSMGETLGQSFHFLLQSECESSHSRINKKAV